MPITNLAPLAREISSSKYQLPIKNRARAPSPLSHLWGAIWAPVRFYPMHRVSLSDPQTLTEWPTRMVRAIDVWSSPINYPSKKFQKIFFGGGESIYRRHFWILGGQKFFFRKTSFFGVFRWSNDVWDQLVFFDKKWSAPKLQKVKIFLNNFEFFSCYTILLS